MKKRFLSAVLAAAMSMSLLSAAVSAASIQDTAKELKIGGSVSGKLESSNKENPKDYYVKVTGTGVLKLTVESWTYETMISVYDSDDRYIKPLSDDSETIQGRTNFRDKDTYISYDSTLKKSKVILHYEVKKGTYYIRMNAGYANSTENFKLSAKANVKSVSEAMFEITLKKGKSISLGTTFMSGQSIKWESNKKSVAQVSSKGKITAKGKGNATITAKNGSDTIKIRVKVT
ncbi:MAG: Ig-like domain-containing protein [Oscillospiraceae bacterium]|jgi:acetone carboxylase gamma subunit|nr:Ig-like domain-containing protein [Oscillospiraceae bacterium]